MIKNPLPSPKTILRLLLPRQYSQKKIPVLYTYIYIFFKVFLSNVKTPRDASTVVRATRITNYGARGPGCILD